MTVHQARNVVALLQKSPLYYRNFGVWWWHVKDELKRNGFDKEQLFHLGDFVDPDVDEFYDGRSDEELDAEAYDYQYSHALEKYNSNAARTPEGDPYLIHDQDVE